MSLTPDDAKKLVEFLKFVEEHNELLAGYNTRVPIEGYIIIGCFTILIYDYMCTFDQEVNYVWSSPWSLGLPLFYINRYVPFIDVALFVHFQFLHMSEAKCARQVQAAVWLISVPSFFGQVIIVLRTCALWQNSPVIVWPLMLLLSITFATTSIFTAKSLAAMEYAPTPSFIKGCLSFDASDMSLYIYVVLFVCELIIIGLTVIKAVQHLRRNRIAWLSQLYHNGIFYCMCILLLSLINIIVPTTSMPYAYKQSMRMPQHVFQSMLCNRVILQLLKHRYLLDRADNLHRRSTADHGGNDPDTSSNIFSTIIIDSAVTTTAENTAIELSTLELQRKQPNHNREWIS